MKITTTAKVITNAGQFTIIETFDAPATRRAGKLFEKLGGILSPLRHLCVATFAAEPKPDSPNFLLNGASYATPDTSGFVKDIVEAIEVNGEAVLGAKTAKAKNKFMKNFEKIRACLEKASIQVYMNGSPLGSTPTLAGFMVDIPRSEILALTVETSTEIPAELEDEDAEPSKAMTSEELAEKKAELIEKNRKAKDDAGESIGDEEPTE